ncbi:MAG: nucleotidyl transferase AbiEii/AbiGii toxin family protein [Oscillospiraceae bacterium]|nr:nucleotidyl transferase AbiEii/AbiGii toxin family protein [Oscillospiraceae bacterium]
MYLHLQKENFIRIIKEINFDSEIPLDILEKDYYVCLILQELAKNQDNLKAYFKGGTALYKILDTNNRFSEDIDLTVEVVEIDSKTSNKKRLERSALGYKIEGLELQKDRCDQRMSKSVTALYKYETNFEEIENQLHKAGEVQVESTSFTISEPTEKVKVESLIYKHATDTLKEFLKMNFDLGEFEIETLTIERIFIDKLFAAAAYYRKQQYPDLAKHLYDITILFELDRIQKLFEDKTKLKQILDIQKTEESARYGGINDNTEMKDFEYMNSEFNSEIEKAFESMQDKYIYNSEYRISIAKVNETLKQIREKLQ